MEIIYIIIVCLMVICLWIFNNVIVVSIYDMGYSKRKKCDVINIVHVSDLHNKSFGKNQNQLIKKIKAASPDVMFITGDLVDDENYGNAEIFIKYAREICPIYYVTGNHEYMAGNFDEIKEMLEKYKVHILLNKMETFDCKGKTIRIYGLDDPFVDKLEYYEDYMIDQIKSFQLDAKYYNILLSHRPELLKIYSEYNFDLVLCGHAHGGQFRLPFFGGLIAPNQGLFPKYYQGRHILNNTCEIISRGLGNSVIPIRVFNQPELVIIKLYQSL